MTAARELVHPAVEQSRLEVFGGVDTHKDTHTAAAVDTAGRMLGHRQFPATAAGYAALWGWLAGLGAEEHDHRVVRVHAPVLRVERDELRA